MNAGNELYAQLSDEQLLTKAKAQDIEAFNQLHKRYRERILNYVYRFLGKYQIAEEITQETFIRVYTNLSTCRVENVAGWIYTIARNLAMNELRRAKYEPTISLDAPVSQEEGASRLIEYVADSSAPEETLARQRELENRIQKAIESLPPKYREVIILCGFQSFSYKEAARTLHCSVHSIGVRLFRARELMRKLYLVKKEDKK